MTDDDINCTRFWELPPEEQDKIIKFLKAEYEAGADCWGPWGDTGESARCRKCGFYRLAHNKDETHWCRRCRYLHYNEYFGPDGYNTKWMKYFYLPSLDTSPEL
jgi:hypothetical protein